MEVFTQIYFFYCLLNFCHFLSGDQTKHEPFLIYQKAFFFFKKSIQLLGFLLNWKENVS